MPNLYVPWPRFDRRVYLLLLDDEQRLFLCGACCRGWTVPQVRLGAGCDYRGEANRFLLRRFGLTDPRYSALYGLHQSRREAGWENERRTASRVFLVRVSREESAVMGASGEGHVRWGITMLKQRRREIFPEGVVLLAVGYVEGWLPDGPIELT